MNTRRAELALTYNGVDISSDLTDYLLDFTYTDAAPGELDDLQLTLEDRHQLWQGPWSPTQDDEIQASLATLNWDKPGEYISLPCGVFFVDSVTCSGGDKDTVSIRAVSLPLQSAARQERRTKSFENVTLLTIAKGVADTANLELAYYATDNPTYERQDQTEQTDLGFLTELARDEGIAAKITGSQLVLFDETFYEQQDAALTLTRGKDDIASFSFEWNATNAAYRSCELTYTNATDDKTISVTYSPPGAPESGPVLKVRESVKTEEEALRKAKNRLREHNKQYGKGSMSLPGDVRLASGITIQLSGWGHFDGKYLVESATHRIGGDGYTTDIDIRKVLGW